MEYSWSHFMRQEPAQKTPEPKHLEGLNDAQRKAVETRGAVLVLAGAGAGKTKTIAARIVQLIREGVAPRAILAITFTNKAAQEMRGRVEGSLRNERTTRNDLPLHTPFVSTFHGLCVQVLREFGHHTNIPNRFTIFDRADSKQIIKEALLELELDLKQFDPGQLLSAISREKGNVENPASLKERAGGDFGQEIISRVWESYDKRVRAQKGLDFDDLLLETVHLLKRHQETLDELRSRWTHVHVDEYQDTNRVQYELVRLLSEPRGELFAVGDIDQTIYTWRGAHIRNLLHFEKDFPNTTVIVLEENYRSTKTILDAANAVIKKNTVRYEKTLRGNRGDGEPVGVYAGYDETDEASYVAEKTKELIAHGVPAREIAVLYRANFQSRAIESAFLEARVPYQVLGTRFFERKEVKDALSYLRAAHNPESVADLKRIINVPPRGLGKLTLLKLLSGKEQELNAGQKRKIADFRALLERVRSASRGKPSDAVKFVIKEAGLEGMYRHDGEEQERIENMRELATVASLYDQLPSEEALDTFLSDAALSGEQDELTEGRDAVRLMTIHASKGLEFDCVFITGLEQDLFPHSNEHKKESVEEAEEERRLFYVALTRARKRLFLSYANIRTIFGNRAVNLPSEFLSDIEEVPWRAESHPNGRHRGLLKTIRFD